ncbi:hypothetical protein GCM10011415_37290 [Salipiger pallidus]|uniref:Uncharacterized protein n=1 Tax=Salipiger pallidus TaxID=1775170 RepID=A0A8J2ZMU6_9RHOB|nr:hypothetical protein GCM10011415_37290 [Salipiger pallidus]
MGRRIVGYPATNASAALRVVIAAGTFQGLIAALPKMGWRITVKRWSRRGRGSSRPEGEPFDERSGTGTLAACLG